MTDPLDQVPALLAVSEQLAAVRLLRSQHDDDPALRTIERHLRYRLWSRAYHIAGQIERERDQRKRQWGQTTGQIAELTRHAQGH